MGRPSETKIRAALLLQSYRPWRTAESAVKMFPVGIVAGWAVMSILSQPTCGWAGVAGISISRSATRRIPLVLQSQMTSLMAGGPHCRAMWLRFLSLR